MIWLLALGEICVLAMAAVGLWRLRAVVRHTTLTTVLPWAWVAWTSAMLGCLLRLGGHTAIVSYVDYFTAVAVLSPPMAALGARRPTCRSWPFFVLLPMFAVLCWPAISVGLATRFSRPLELETPAVVMYGVVLVMALGNYALGRLGPLVGLMGWLLMGMIGGTSTIIPTFPADVQRFLATVIGAMILWRFRTSASASPALMFEKPDVPKSKFDAFDRTLLEFSELYGLVWWLRMQDRLNVFAIQQRWPGQFAGSRGQWTEPLTESQRAEIEHAFRWLLRRFVSSTWLDARLPPHGTSLADQAFTSPIDS